jgi:gas vesicle protein
MMGRQHFTTFLVGGAVGFLSAVMLANRGQHEANTTNSNTMTTGTDYKKVDDLVSKQVLDNIKSVIEETDVKETSPRPFS